MAKADDKQPADLSPGDTTKRFTDTMRRLLAVPKEDMPRREEEYRKAHPKKSPQKPA